MANYYGDMCFSEKYKDKNGEEKTTYHKFGKVFTSVSQQGEKRMSIFVPLLDRWFSVFPKRERDDQNQQQSFQGNAQMGHGNPPPPAPPADEPF